MNGYGFRNTNEFVRSFIRPDLLKSDFIIITSLSGSLLEVLTHFTNYAFGLTGWLFIILIVLIFVEFSTGIKASNKEFKESGQANKKFNSRRFNGGILKALIWLLFLSSFWALAQNLNQEWMRSIVKGIHGIASIFIISSYIISISENMVRLGYTEFRVFKKLINKKIIKKLENEN